VRSRNFAILGGRRFYHTLSQYGDVMTDLSMDAKAAVARAKREVAEEAMKKAVDKLKVKLRERDAAATVLANVDREIKDLELAIEQGNI